MAQNDNTNGFAIGFAIVATVAIFMLVFLLIVIEIVALAFAAFLLLVVNWHYKIIGLIAGVVLQTLLVQPLQTVISNLYRQLDIVVLVWAYQLAPWGLMAVGFIGAVFILDFINDQRNMPTSDQDFLAWRIRWGFTKGLDIDQAPGRQQHSSTQNVFDVPPQDRT